MNRSAEARKLALQGHKLPEIARMLDIRRETVRQALNRPKADGRQTHQQNVRNQIKEQSDFGFGLPGVTSCAYCGWRYKGVLGEGHARFQQHKCIG